MLGIWGFHNSEDLDYDIMRIRYFAARCHNPQDYNILISVCTMAGWSYNYYLITTQF